MSRVAVYDDDGVGKSTNDLQKCLETFSDISFQRITAEKIWQGGLAQFDVLINPGGSGSGQGRSLGAAGRSSVRRFVADGGGFLGVCAGAYLASSDYPWSLHLLDTRVHDKAHWNRGTGEVTLVLTPLGKEILDTPNEAVEIFYGQGPLLVPAHTPGVAEYTLLATYSTEIAKKGAPEGVMVGTSAIASARFGDGRVFCFSPHPEKTDGLGEFVRNAIHWVSAPQKIMA